MSQKTQRRQLVGDELQGLDFGDRKRSKRGTLVGERLGHAPGASIPHAMLGEAETVAAYRHLSTEEVTLGEVVAPHVLKTRARVLEAGEALAIHDTTEASFGGASKRRGLGPLNGKDQGFLAHLSIAVSADGERIPLGLLAVGTRVRKSVGQPTGVESRKWALGIEQASQHLPVEALIHVADRESDIFELIAQMAAENRRYVFRAAQDRGVLVEVLGEEQCSWLFAAARTAESVMEVDVELSARADGKRPSKDRVAFPERRKRKATLAYSALTLELKRPGKKPANGLPATVKVNVVRAWEPEPPAGQPPVEWILLTSERVDTPEAIRRAVDFYRARWTIEEFNKAVKSGCGYEKAQLESAHALFSLFGYCLVVAYGLLLMRALSRSKKKIPASHFFTPAQIACLRTTSRKRKLSAHPTVNEALLACAGLGGHLKRNGPPGWQTMSRGYSRLLDYELGYLAAGTRGAKL